MKRILTLLITILIVFSAMEAGVFASSSYEAELLSDLSIMQGDSNGNMRYTDKVTRAECAKIAVAASKYRDSVASNSKSSPFKDVNYDHWSAPFVTVGIKNGLFKGYLDATFRPSNTVTYEEAIAMFLRVLDYTDEDIGDEWPYDHIDMAKKIGMTDGVNASVGQELTRRDISKIIYNTLNSNAKGSQEKYLNSFSRTIGPITVASSNWYEELGADASIRIIRDGVESSLSEVRTNDIAYYMVEYKKAFVYSKKVTGIYEDASPNKDTPTSVTVSGVTYNIEGDDAYSKLSSGGNLNYGDTVTLLLGKSGDVAGVATKLTDDMKVIGFLSAIGTKDTIVSGKTATKPYIKVVLPSGDVCEYITDKNYKDYLNKVVTVNLVDGIATVKTITQEYDISGMVVWDSGIGTIGRHALASDVKIIETSTTESYETATVASVYPQRLNGLNIDKYDILYVSKNSVGNIDELILRDATGDTHTYGVVTYAKNNSSNMQASGNYKYIINGIEGALSTQNRFFSVSKGQAVRIKGDGREVTSMTPLTLINSNKITDITGSAITVGNNTYTMSDKVQIYVESSYPSAYSMITIEELAELADECKAYVYADKTHSVGGRVRVIILRTN